MQWRSALKSSSRRSSPEELVVAFVSAKAGIAATGTRPIRSFLVLFIEGAHFRVRDIGFGGLLPNFVGLELSNGLGFSGNFMDNSLSSPHGLPGRTGSGFRGPAPRLLFPSRHVSGRC